MNWLFSIHWVIIASVWYFGNGILHSATVLIQHKGKYDLKKNYIPITDSY
jgi:hypothetical protein